MAHYGNRHRSLQLSLYLDGSLDDDKRQEIERLIDEDEDIRREYNQLKSLQSLLASRKPLPENPFLAERVMNLIRKQAEEENRGIPATRRLVPVSATFIIVLLTAAALFTWLQRERIFNYVEQTGTQMQQAYEESILKGWIMPLFERTDRDQVLHFAMFGILPLDNEDGAVLRVDESSDSGYRVELANASDPGYPRSSISELYDEIQPSPVQRRVFDSLFLYAQRQIESSVLMNEEKEIAIDPAISKYHKVILSGIASTLDSGQLLRFEKFLAQRNTPYTFVSTVSHRIQPRSEKGRPSTVIEHFRTVRMPEEFIVLTRDSISHARLRLNMDSLRHLMRIVENRMPRLEVLVGELAERYSRSPSPPDAPPPPHVRVIPEKGPKGRSFRILIQADETVVREMENEMKQVMREIAILRKDTAELHRYGGHYSRSDTVHGMSAPRTDIEVFVTPDSEMEMTINIDSILEHTFRSLEEMQEFRDSLSSQAPGKGVQFEWRQGLPAKPARPEHEIPAPQPAGRDTVFDI